MGTSFKITREQILKVYAAGPEAVIALIEGIIEQQEQRITALEQELQELKKDSHDSGKPPSRDSFERKQLHRKQSRLKRTTAKRPGGQPEHAGATLRQVAQPDTITIHPAESCTCGCSLHGEPVADYERRQVFDLPPLQVAVSEHRAERKRCPDCGQLNAAEFPAAVTQPVQYGPRLQAVAAYLRSNGLLPYQRTAELFADLFSTPVSAGTLVTINDRCGERLSGLNEALRAAVSAQPVVCFDETGMSIGGELHWLHVASTELLTYYEGHAKRGREAFAAIAILPNFGGTAVPDNWQSYFGYPCSHGLCSGHHLRELTFIHEQYGQDWAPALIELLVAIKGAVDSAVQEQRPQLQESVRERFVAAYHRIINAGLRANPAPPEAPGSPKKRGRKKQSKARNLLLRLASRWRQVLAFMDDFGVLFDNNQAERDLRMMKVQQKISGTFRSAEGAVAFCRTRSYISTIRKNGLNVLEALTSVFAGHPMTPPCLKPAHPAE